MAQRAGIGQAVSRSRVRDCVMTLGNLFTPRYTVTNSAYSKCAPRTNCALRIKKCAPRISSGICFLTFKHKLINK